MFQGKIRRAALAALCALAMAAGAPAGVAGSLPDRERLEIALDAYSEEQVARAAYDALNAVYRARLSDWEAQRWTLAVVDGAPGQEPLLEVRFWRPDGSYVSVGLRIGWLDPVYVGCTIL